MDGLQQWCAAAAAAALSERTIDPSLSCALTTGQRVVLLLPVHATTVTADGRDKFIIHPLPLPAAAAALLLSIFNFTLW